MKLFLLASLALSVLILLSIWLLILFGFATVSIFSIIILTRHFFLQLDFSTVTVSTTALLKQSGSYKKISSFGDINN